MIDSFKICPRFTVPNLTKVYPFQVIFYLILTYNITIELKCTKGIFLCPNMCSHFLICCLIKFLHWKLKRFVSAPKSDFRSKSYSAPSGTIWAQFKPKQPNQNAILAHAEAHFSPWGPNQPEIIRLYCNWFKGAKLDSKIGLYFTHRNGPIFRAKRSGLSDLPCKFGLKVDTSCSFVRWNRSAIFISLIIKIVRRRRMIKRYRVFWFAENIKSA